jgi:hypothetical protein
VTSVEPVTHMKEIKMLILFRGLEPCDSGLFCQHFRAVAIFVFMFKVEKERKCFGYINSGPWDPIRESLGLVCSTGQQG